MTIELSPATAARLRSLRWRMTALIALLATAAVTVFAVVVVRLDRELRDEQIDAELLRRADEATRSATFEDGDLTGVDPTIGLDGVVLAVNPSFSVAEFQQRQDRLGLPDPTDEDLERHARSTFLDADFETRVELIAWSLERSGDEPYVDDLEVEALLDDGEVVAGPIEVEGDDGGTETLPRIEVALDEVIEVLLGEPPAELADEAYRRSVLEQADEAGVELEFETTYLGVAGAGVPEVRLAAAAERIVEDEVGEYRETVAAGPTRLVLRATPLRDGPQVRGAVIALVDPTEFDAAHTSLRSRVVVLALAIVGISVVGAWFVAGRTLRPTARALAQQERFLADAAHELRTPVTAIRLTAESATPDTAVANLGRVAALAAEASTLTDDLLTLARMDADRMELQREPVRLDLLVETALAETPGAEEAVATRLDAVVVDADPGLVARAVGNLVRNALAHGGASPDRPASVVVEVDGSLAVVTVRDHGPGLAPEVAGRLFERFGSRTGSSGHGLGLPLARWIARAHGGDLVHAEPPDGPGATFRMTLPGPAGTDRLLAGSPDVRTDG